VKKSVPPDVGSCAPTATAAPGAPRKLLVRGDIATCE
jgi:hypothetical protein